MQLQSLCCIRLPLPARRSVGHTTPVLRVQRLVQLLPPGQRVRLLQRCEMPTAYRQNGLSRGAGASPWLIPNRSVASGDFVHYL